MTAWWAIDVHVPNSENRAAVAAWLVDATGQAVEERPDGTLVATVAGDAASADLARTLRERWGAAATSDPAQPVEDVDWSTRWREGLGPRAVGSVTLCPSWLTPEAGAATVLLIDPESAFGSGEHGSTRAALLLLDRHLQPGHTVLDLGTGSGILALAAAKLGAGRTVGIDDDGAAVAVAERNAGRNGVAGVAFVEGDAGLLAPLLGPADLVVSNILRSVNVRLLPAIAASLQPGGRAIFSGMETDEAPLFHEALRAARWRVTDDTEDDGWWAVVAAPW